MGKRSRTVILAGAFNRKAAQYHGFEERINFIQWKDDQGKMAVAAAGGGIMILSILRAADAPEDGGAGQDRSAE